MDKPRVEEILLPANTDTPEVRISSGSIYSLAQQLVGFGASFLIGIVVARTLGPAGKGQLSLVMQVPGLLIVLLNLGISQANVRYVSQGELDPKAAVGNSIVIATALGMIAAPIVYMLLEGPFAVARDVPHQAVVFAMLVLPLGLAAASITGVSIGLGNLVLPFWYAVASSLTTLAGFGALSLFGAANVTSVVALSVAGTVVGVALMLFGMRRMSWPWRFDSTAARSVAQFSAKAYIGDITGFLHNRLDILILGWLAGSAAVGLYSVGVSFAELALYVPTALSTAVLAKAGRTDSDEGLEFVSRSTRSAVLLTLLTMALLAAAVPGMVWLLFGAAFIPSVLAFFVLLPGVLADGVTRIVWNYQVGRGRIYWMLSLVMALLNVAAVVVLVPLFGFVGAAAASSLTYTALACFVIGFFCRETGAKPLSLVVPQRRDVSTLWSFFREAMPR